MPKHMGYVFDMTCRPMFGRGKLANKKIRARSLSKAFNHLWDLGWIAEAGSSQPANTDTPSTWDLILPSCFEMCERYAKASDEKFSHDVDRMLPIVADNWTKLRKVDVPRLASQFVPSEMPAFVRVVAEKRPDLRKAAQNAAEVLVDEASF